MIPVGLWLAAPRRHKIVIALAASAALALSGLGIESASASTRLSLALSLSPDRSNGVRLDGSTVKGKIYVFVRNSKSLDRVDFYVDSPRRTRMPPVRTDKKPPFDLAGTAADGRAHPYDTAQLAGGVHTIRVVLTWADGSTSGRRARFRVGNQGATAAPTALPTPSTTASATAANTTASASNIRGSSPLPFTLPSQAILKGSSKKVFAHYFTPYPISIDNKPAARDYYDLQYLNPTGEGSKHAAYGGFLRERPLPRPADPSTNYLVNDMKTEVLRASNAGLDGFAVDILSISGYNWDRFKALLQAAPHADPNFRIIIMPDSTASGVGAGADAFAAAIAGIVNDPAYNKSLFRLKDGRLVVSPFYPEKQGAAWWQDWLRIMKSRYGIDIAFVPCFLNYGANANAFQSFSYGFSNWGNRNPASNSNLSANITDAHHRGKIWMQPVSLQDTRPNQAIYDEANNSENLRVTWNAAIRGADWVQIPTWNDYSENAQISPSTHIGWGPLNISSYYLTRYKTGAAPTINRDVLYLSHRIQPHAATPTGRQTSLMRLRTGSSPARDTVEVLSFLTAPATITVKVGNTTNTYSAPAGVFAKTYPLRAGKVSAVAVRDSTTVAEVISPFPVVQAPPVQDLNYYFSISNP